MDVRNIKCTKRAILCNIVIVLLLYQSLLERIFIVFRYFDEILALVVLGYSLLCCIYNGKVKKNKYYITMFTCIFLYCFIGTVSSIMYHYQPFILTFSGAILSLKWFALMAGGCAIAKNKLTRRDYHDIKCGVYINIAIMLLWEILTIRVIDLKYALYAWDLCAKCVFIACIIFMEWDGDRKDYMAVGVTIFMLALSGKAKGYAAIMVILFTLIWVIKKKAKIEVMHLTIIGAIALTVAWDKISYYYIFGKKYDFSRYRLFRTAIDIANDYFPVGTGWSTYGSYFSVERYSPVYYLYGISEHRELGIESKLFLCDNYLASVCAETGWIGMMAIFIFCVSIFLFIQKNFGIEREMINSYAAAFSILSYMVITTVEETGFAQPVLACLGLLMGIALYRIGNDNAFKRG